MKLSETDPSEMMLYQPENGAVVLYNPDDTLSLEVRLSDDTVWLSQQQMVELFQSSKPNVSEHLKNIFTQGELNKESTVRNFRTLRKEGLRLVERNLTYYNLDVIISVGFRVNTQRGILFRQWANRILKDYMLKGYAINHRVEQLENRMLKAEEKIDFFVRTALPPQQGIFYDGQLFDAYAFACDLIRSAKSNIILIDNYVDDSVLKMLDKRSEKVSAVIYTRSISSRFQLDLEKHDAQYQSIGIKIFKNAHDRFLMIDNDVYHLGASLKDIGKKWFAFNKMAIEATELLDKINASSLQ